MAIREEKLVIGTKKEIYDYLIGEYHIVDDDDRACMTTGDNFWMPSLSYDQQVEAIMKANTHGFGLIIFIKGEDVSQDEMPTVQFNMMTVYVWLRTSAKQTQAELEALSELAKNYSKKNILTNINLEE